MQPGVYTLGKSSSQLYNSEGVGELLLADAFGVVFAHSVQGDSPFDITRI